MSIPTSASNTTPVAKTKGDAVSAVAVVGTHYPPLIKDDAELLRYGVVRVPLCALRKDDEKQQQQHGMDNQDDTIMSQTVTTNDDNNNNNNNNTEEEHPIILDLAYWAAELSQVTPAILADQGDNEYAFYRNILEEPDFPFDDILRKSQVGEAMKRHFNVSIASPAVVVDDDHHHDDDIRLDDAFCVHYNTSQEDSSGARHMDPCDITVNICLQASPDMQGSQVLFFGKQTLSNVPITTTLNCPVAQKTAPEEEQEEEVANESSSSSSEFSFLVEQIPGTATIHWGHHPHQTLPITAGQRTNIVMTFIYSDPSRKSDATTRTCYG